MTEPLISRDNDIGISYHDDLVDEIISSLAETTSNINNAPDYAQNCYFGHQKGTALFLNTNDGYVNANAFASPNGSINANSTFPGYSNGVVTGFDNMEFLGEEIDTSAISEQRGCQIDYIQFPDKVLKQQRRVAGRESHQRLRIEDAKVKLAIRVAGVAQVSSIKVFVARAHDPSFQLSNVIQNPIEIEAQTSQGSLGEYRLHVNLDSIYEVDGKKVYALAKNKTEEVNQFYLKIVIIFIDGTSSEANTKCFRIVGKEKNLNKAGQETSQEELVTEDVATLPPPVVSGSKRQRTDTDESANSSVSLKGCIAYQPNACPSPGNLSSMSGYASAASPDDGLIKASRIAADYLEAKNAEIGSLIVAEPIKTRGADIAYHFILKNPQDHPQFLEGEIVGLFDNGKGDRTLDKITQNNSLDAILKGVISQSQYLEANVQPEGVRTETVCMFGIVPVRVEGSVKRGEILYASSRSPGVAVGSSNLDVAPSLLNDAAAIGMSWETISAFSNEINNVSCLVSVTMEVFQGMIEKRMKSLKRAVKHDLDDIRKARKCSRKRSIICFTSIFLFLVSLSILLWQIFMPMSALRRAICEIGSIKGHSASFSYIPTSNIYDIYRVSGDEFEFHALMTKVDSNFLPINGTGYTYYYNINLCANGGRSMKDPVLNKKNIGGPVLFATDKACQSVYYHYDAINKWCKYKSARNIKCRPSQPAQASKLAEQDSGPGYCS